MHAYNNIVNIEVNLLSKKRTPDRSHFMTDKQKHQLGNLPRTHENCKAYTGVCRPGKTARDKARSKDV